MPPRQLMGVIGVVMVAVGVFCPFVSFPIVGSISYFANGKGDGTIVLAAALLAGGLVLGHYYKQAGLLGAAILALIGFAVFQFQSKMGEAKAEMTRDLHDNPFSGLAEGMMNTVQLQWGIGLMVVGALLIIAAAVWNPSASSRGEA
jgi:hypothetical protein